MIDWTDKVQLRKPRKNAPDRTEMHYAVYCDVCDRKRYLRKSDAERVTMCWICQRRDAGRHLDHLTRLKGNQTNALRKPPTSLEAIAIRYLDAAGLDYRRAEIIITEEHGPFIVDFFLPTENLVLEVDGDYAHRNRKQYDTFKTRALKSAGYRVHRFAESGLVNVVEDFIGKLVGA